jgi:hypothetical protein
MCVCEYEDAAIQRRWEGEMYDNEKEGKRAREEGEQETEGREERTEKREKATQNTHIITLSAQSEIERETDRQTDRK